MLLEGESLQKVYNKFRQKFKLTGDGLTLVEFVKTMFEFIPDIDLLDKRTSVWVPMVQHRNH